MRRSFVLVSLLVLTFLMVGSLQVSADMVQIRGSDTEVNLVQRLTEVFMDENPGSYFAVTGGGSGTGIAGLINKQIDIANSSRAMSETEIEQARNNGVEPVPFIFAQDGLAVIVNSSNSVQELTIDEIGAIFRGEITNWKDVGGNDQEISLYGRQSNSGTFVYFRANVVKGDYSPQKKMMNGNAQIVEGVLADQAGIGYIGIGYAVDGGVVVPGLNVLKVAADENSPAVTPLELENIMQGLYPIVRPLFHYTDGKPEGHVKGYLEFIMTEAGQNIVIQEGFFPITDDYREQNRANL